MQNYIEYIEYKYSVASKNIFHYLEINMDVFRIVYILTWATFVLCAGIVVEDCLLLLLNLLKNNSSNQNFFKEGSYIQRMKPWFEVGDDNSGWSAQKVTNLHLMLQVTQDTRRTIAQIS